jgi:hypothetical protein
MSRGGRPPELKGPLFYRLLQRIAGTEPHLSPGFIASISNAMDEPRRLDVNCTQADMQDSCSKDLGNRKPYQLGSRPFRAKSSVAYSWGGGAKAIASSWTLA